MAGKKVRFELEYMFNASPSILYSRLSTASGLAEWFADNVNLKDKNYVFIWKGYEQKAHQVLCKENRMVRYQWIDNDDEEDNTFFEFRISEDELTGEIGLTVIDFAEPSEIKDATSLWNQQIEELKHVVGSH